MSEKIVPQAPCLQSLNSDEVTNYSGNQFYFGCFRAEENCPMKMQNERGEGNKYFEYLAKKYGFIDLKNLGELREKLLTLLNFPEDGEEKSIALTCSACVNQIEKLLLEDLGLTGKSDKSQNCDHDKLWV